MEWWQITLILLGSAVVGIGGGILLSRLINHFARDRFMWKRRMMPMAEKQKPETVQVADEDRHRMASAWEEQKQAAPSVAGNKGRKEGIGAVPLLSRRSIVFLLTGLIVGSILGLLYWAISPSLAEMEIEPAQSLQSHTGPYEATVSIQVVNPGPSYTSLGDLRRRAEYYAAKMNSLPFLEFLGQELAELGPQYSYTTQDLDQIIDVNYEISSEPPTIMLRLIGSNVQETLHFATLIPETFQNYLIAEETGINQQEYQNTLEKIENVKNVLLAAEKELTSLRLQASAGELENDATYLELNARVEALQLQLNSQARNLSILIAEGKSRLIIDDETTLNYIDVLKSFQRTSAALSEAKSELSVLKARAGIDSVVEDLEYQATKTKVDNLNRELVNLTERLSSSLGGNTQALEVIDTLAIGSASVPIPVIPDRIRLRNALSMGGVLGMGGAWVVLNRRWFTKGTESAGDSEPEEDEERAV